MMECYQKCIDIGKRCYTSLGSTGTCTDCGQICRSNFFKPDIPECKCKTTPAFCQNKKTVGESSQHARPGDQGTSASREAEGKPAPREKKEKKQSFWQWLLSLFGFGVKEEESDEEAAAAEKRATGRPQSVKSHKPTETFSPDAILAEVKEICGEIKKLKPESPIKVEQSSPPAAQRQELKESVTQTSPSPEAKKKKKGKSPPRSASREKYLGKPLQSSPPRRSSSSSRSRSPPHKEKSPPRKEKTPVRRESVPGIEKSPAGGEYQCKTREKSPVCPKSRPPTSPIYSSERYLKPYSSALCVLDSACQQCCECSPETSPSHVGGSDRKRNSCGSKRSTACHRGNASTMHCRCCSCSICCRKTCAPSCRPASYCDPICYTPCCKPLFTSCSFCCCRPELRNMKRQRASFQGSCSPRTRDRGSRSKRRRCSSCPSSPCCTRLPYGAPLCPPCPPCLPRPCSPSFKLPPCGPPCCCPLSSECSRSRYACRSPCPLPLSFKPSCSICPPPRSISPAFCPRPCRPSPTSICAACPVTCMKPCCMPCVSTCPPKCPQKCSAPSPGPQFSFPHSGAMRSYSMSKDNDSLCKQLMARYNITAPEPRAFCPLPRSVCSPRNVCVPCDVVRIPPPKSFSSRRAPGCAPCTRGSCYNNNKPLSFTKTMDCDNFTYSLNTPSPFRSRVKDPITFNTSPCHSLPRKEFRIPKRTPVHCIKERGPRSPCKEYMTTYRFLKEPRREITVTHHNTENEQPSLTEEKISESTRKASKKIKTQSQSDAKGRTTESAEQNVKGEAGDNLSENKAVFGDSRDSDGSSSLHSWRISRNKPHKKNTRSKSSDAMLKPYVVHKENKSPVKTGKPAEWSTYGRRYSQSTKSFYPSFMSLSPTYQISKQAAILSVPPIFDQMQRFAPKTSMVELSRNAKIARATVSYQPCQYQPTGSTYSYQFAHKLDDYGLAKSIETNVRYPRAKWNLPSTHAHSKKYLAPPALHHIKFEDNSTNEMNVEANDTSSSGETGVKETDSNALLPKVESISSLVEKYDRVEVSAIGVMAQSKCNIFDYISADSSSAITSSLKEDQSPSILEELPTEENAVHETTHVDPKRVRSEPAALGDLIDDSEDESMAMNKNQGASKINQAQGDIDRPYREIKSSPHTKDETKISDSIGDNLHAPVTDLKFETVNENIDLSNCCYDNMRGESSVDPAEYGTIGESAVDPCGCNYKCQMEDNPFKSLVNQSNYSNNVEPGDPREAKIDPVEPMGIGEGEQGASEAVDIPNKVVEGMLKADGTNCQTDPKSALEELLGSSGVRWAKVRPSTEADLKLLRLGKAAYSRKANVDPSTNRQPGASTASSSSSMNGLSDHECQSAIDLLKPGKIAFNTGLSADSDFSCDSPTSQIRLFGTPV